MYAEFFIEAAASSLPSESHQDTITPRDIWNEMLRLEVLYELPKVRGMLPIVFGNWAC